MIWTQHVNGHLIVMHQTGVVYKNWPSGQSVVVDPYGVPWSPRAFEMANERKALEQAEALERLQNALYNASVCGLLDKISEHATPAIVNDFCDTVDNYQESLTPAVEE